MKVVTVASRKGGSSKTTLCVHLAGLADADGGCLIVDADPQRSAVAWYELRRTDRPLVIPADPGGLVEILRMAAEEAFPFTLIDTAPHAEAIISEAMRVADLVAVPVRPSLFDLRAADATFSMAAALKKPAIAILTGCPPSMTGGEAIIVREARAYLATIGAEVCSTTIGQRAAYSHALLSGSNAGEYEPNGKAARECAALWAELKGKLR